MYEKQFSFAFYSFCAVFQLLVSIYREVFVESDNANRQDAFAKLVLSRLNTGGWWAFDERFPPALPLAGRTYVGLVIEKHYLDTRLYGQTGTSPTVRVEHIYTYDLRVEV